MNRFEKVLWELIILALFFLTGAVIGLVLSQEKYDPHILECTDIHKQDSSDKRC